MVEMPANSPIKAANLLPAEAEAMAFLVPLSADYPGIDRWYLEKVVAGLRDGTRTLVRVERGGKLIGLGIGKNDGIEKKICTVRVAPEHVGRGSGVRIFDQLLRWLDTDHPHLTVSGASQPKFQRIFDWYGFQLTSVHNGLYVPGRQELGYNELNTQRVSLTNLDNASSKDKLVEASATTSGIPILSR